MGDAGSNLLGLLMGCVAVEGDLKTSAVVAFALPMILLAVPFLDTTFVVLKRLKYGRPVYAADQEHLHHRMARIGYSARRTLLFFYGWTLMLAGLAVALRFIPYSDGPRPPASRLVDPRRRARPDRARRQRLPDLRARDLPLGHAAAPAQAEAGRHR